MPAYATISVPIDVKRCLQKAKGKKEWGEFLLELYSETQQLKSRKAFHELIELTTEEDLKTIAEESKDFPGEIHFQMSLLDTGVIIDMIGKKEFRSGVISPITLIEVLRGFEDSRRQKIRKLLEESFPLLDLDNSTIETYCIIYRKLKQRGVLLPDADLIIAASAMAHDLTLETTDKHFQRLKPMGLKIE